MRSRASDGSAPDFTLKYHRVRARHLIRKPDTEKTALADSKRNETSTAVCKMNAQTAILETFADICGETNNGAIFERFPMHTLVGFADETQQTKSEDECLEKCFVSTNCRSVMFYPEVRFTKLPYFFE